MADVRQRRFEELPAANPSAVRSLAEDHPAIVQGTTLFEGTVVRADKSDRLFISGANNRKIGRVVVKGAWKGMPIYMLTLVERKTCPSSCHMWGSCYGNAMPFARRHAPGPELEDRIKKEIAKLSREHPDGFVVRLHILGDFYSAEYASMWAALMEKHEQLHVYGYTALGTSGSLEHSVIIDVLEAIQASHNDRFALRWSSEEPIPMGACVIDRVPESANVEEGLVCPAERDATACCATCGLCWEGAARDKTIVFVKHGMGSKASETIATAASAADADNVRAVAPIGNIARLSGTPANDVPTMLWVKPTDLHVDQTYQRNLSSRSIKLITKIVQHWDWTRYKPPIVTKDPGSGKLYILDGQHTAIAAATHSEITQIPVMIVTADALRDRASAFLGHNRDRISLTPAQLHHSAVAAFDPMAVTINKVCAAAGVTVLRYPPPNSVFNPGETIAISTISKLIKGYGEERAIMTLKVMRLAECAPLRADQMRAVAMVMFGERPSPPGAVERALTSITYDAAYRAAKDYAASAGLPVWEAMAHVYGAAARNQIAEAAE